jgi:hypothetical protein
MVYSLRVKYQIPEESEGEKMTICLRCKNCIFYRFLDKSITDYKCKYGISNRNIEECTHFEPKPKDYSQQSQKANSLLKKGKEPRKKKKDCLTCGNTHQPLCKTCTEGEGGV